jgi:N-acetylglucosamine kinase-like BadF-type ATPase
MPREQIAALAPTVARLAGDGDEAAGGIMQRAADDLADMARAAVLQAGWDGDTFPAVVCGGVLDGSETLRTLVTQRLADVVPGAEPIDSRFAPVVGAALLAMRTASASTPDIVANLSDTLPDTYKTGS